MGYKLLRESSETPNITNRDDSKMIRYAYGNHTGVVKNFGRELEITYSGSTCTIHSGILVVDGWEIELDEEGVSFEVSLTGNRFYSVIATVILVSEEIRFTFTSNSGAYPEVGDGDDLTLYPNGSKQIVTHHFHAVNGVIDFSERIVPLIPYLSDIEKRIEDLGFKKGLIDFYAYNKDTEEEYLLNLIEEGADGFVYESYNIIKQGKMALFNLTFSPLLVVPSPPTEITPTHYRLKIGKDFYPKDYTGVSIMEITKTGITIPTTVEYEEIYYKKLTTDTFAIDIPYSPIWSYRIYNFGWELE